MKFIFILLALTSSSLAIAQSSLTLPKLPISLMDDWEDVKTKPSPKIEDPAPDADKSNRPNHQASIPRRVPTENSDARISLPVVNVGSKSVQKKSPPTTAIFNNEITLIPGVVDVQPIAIEHLNRFEMPFDDPQIRTVSSADIQVNGNIVYILSNDPGVVSLYITTPDEEIALSLALLPQKIPPRDVKVRIGKSKGSLGAIAAAQHNPMAKKTEKADDYVGSIRSILAEVSQGKIPRGYAFQKMPRANAKDIHHCYLEGLSITPKQRLDGHRYLITVSKVTNLSVDVIEINERLCYRQGILGVAAWPEVVLNPGQSTELYIVHRREVFKPTYDGEMRPSVID